VLDDRITWRYTSPHNNKDTLIYWHNRIHTVDRQRFKIHRSEDGVFDLVINRVNAADAGVYQCRENDGRYPGETCTDLIVIGKANFISKYSKSYKIKAYGATSFCARGSFAQKGRI